MAEKHSMRDRARTKIVATVGPASRDPKVLATLIKHGVDVFRLNMAHGELSEHEATIRDIRALSAELRHPVAILADLAGPKIRLGKLFEDPTECREGDEFFFVRGDTPNSARQLTCTYDNLVDELSAGDTVMLADGIVGMTVIDKQEGSVRCRVVASGTIRSRQGVNLPGVALSIPALTDDDLRHTEWAASQEIDFVGLSFVRAPDEIRHLKELLRQQKSHALVVAKIEKREAVQHLDAIVQEADAVMVARGDLGVEVDVAMTPVVQKQIIATSQRWGRPVIVATQMLDSMQHSRRPTRAEASDVANAILDGADACMLSGETAIGDYPIETVKMMNRIMLCTEGLLRDAPSRPPAAANTDVHAITTAVVYGAAQVAQQLNAGLVVVVTRTGATARVAAKHRNFIPTIGISDSDVTLRRMCLYWGIHPMVGAPMGNLPRLREFIDRWGREDGCLTTGDYVVYVSGTGMVKGGHNLLLVDQVEE